jgi:hypothetical protein
MIYWLSFLVSPKNRNNLDFSGKLLPICRKIEWNHLQEICWSIMLPPSQILCSALLSKSMILAYSKHYSCRKLQKQTFIVQFPKNHKISENLIKYVYKKFRRKSNSTEFCGIDTENLNCYIIQQIFMSFRNWLTGNITQSHYL